MKFKFTITGIDCPNCAAKLASLMAANEKVDSAKINFLTEKLTVESNLDKDELISILASISKSFDKGIKIEQ